MAAKRRRDENFYEYDDLKAERENKFLIHQEKREDRAISKSRENNELLINRNESSKWQG